jgi:hypothetical protein
MMADEKEAEFRIWRSCCLQMDRQFTMFVVQTIVGVGLLTFCAYRLTVEFDCDRNAPYWGLIGTICGFFFQKVSKVPKPIRTGD